MNLSKYSLNRSNQRCGTATLKHQYDFDPKQLKLHPANFRLNRESLNDDFLHNIDSKGQIEPIKVALSDGIHYVIDGWRRVHACALLKKPVKGVRSFPFSVGYNPSMR